MSNFSTVCAKYASKVSETADKSASMAGKASAKVGLGRATVVVGEKVIHLTTLAVNSAKVEMGERATKKLWKDIPSAKPVKA